MTGVQTCALPISGVAIVGRGGYARFYQYNFVTVGGELNIPVSRNVQILAGLEGFSTYREFSDAVKEKLAEEQGVDPEDIQNWQWIMPINVGVVYKATASNVRPYGGVDITLTPYTASFDLAFGARARAGADFMVAKNFGLNLNLSVGAMWGDKLEETQDGTKDVGVIPQVSGGTVLQF